jgi:hypothetical protein
MATDFYIDLSIQTDQGPTRIGRFNIGQDREKARELFKKMMGSGNITGRSMLFIEFTEVVNGLPVNLDMLTCDLQELGVNCMLIAREMFCTMNLKTGNGLS